MVCCRAALLKLEEDYIERQCAEIAKHKPDLVVTEKGLSDLAMHFLTKAASPPSAACARPTTTASRAPPGPPSSTGAPGHLGLPGCPGFPQSKQWRLLHLVSRHA